MIRLDSSELPDQDALENIELDSNNSVEDDSNNVDATDEVDSDVGTSNGDNSLDSFANDVLSALIDKNVPPLPDNYQAFFEHMLNSRDLDFQKKIYELIEVSGGDSDSNITFEKNIHSAFAKIANLLKCAAAVYKNFLLLSDLQSKIPKPENGDIAKKIEHSCQLVVRQMSEFKAIYNDCNEVLNNISTNTMYDSKFDVYNKRYFIKLVGDEHKSIQKFQHTSTILMVALPNEITKHLTNEQMAMVVMKTIAKLLMKTSRRSDMIGYIGSGIFGMLLKHSDIESSKRASMRLIELLRNTNIFIGSNGITLNLNVGISKIREDRSPHDSLNYAISSLKLAQKTNADYVIYQEDIDA